MVNLDISEEMLEVGESGALASQAIPAGSAFRQLDGKLHTNTDFELLYGLSVERKTDLIFLTDDKLDVVSLEPAEDSRLFLDKISDNPPNLPPVSFKSFKELHRILISSEKNCQFNSEMTLQFTGKKIGFHLKSTRDIEVGEKIIYKFSKENWLRHQLILTENPFLKMILFIFLEAFNKTESLPPKFQPFENFFTKWRSWTDIVCNDFLTKILKAELTDQFREDLNCLGYSERTILYRMLQVK